MCLWIRCRRTTSHWMQGTLKPKQVDCWTGCWWFFKTAGKQQRFVKALSGETDIKQRCAGRGRDTQLRFHSCSNSAGYVESHYECPSQLQSSQARQFSYNTQDEGHDQVNGEDFSTAFHAFGQARSSQPHDTPDTTTCRAHDANDRRGPRGWEKETV